LAEEINVTESVLKTALVTGACGGIGSAIVRRLRALDVTVFAVSNRESELQRIAEETGSEAICLDVSDWPSVSKFLSPLAVDALVNAAAVLGPTSKYHDATPESVQAIVNVNIVGVENLIRAIVPEMVARNRGHVVNFGSIAGVYPSEGQPIYSASKAAVHLMSQNLRMELFGTDVRVSEIRPGRVQTGMHAEMFAGDHAKANELVYADYECLLPADVADAVLYMLRTPPHVNVTHLELLPTHQALGGARFHSRSSNAGAGQERWR